MTIKDFKHLVIKFKEDKNLLYYYLKINDMENVKYFQGRLSVLSELMDELNHVGYYNIPENNEKE